MMASIGVLAVALAISIPLSFYRAWVLSPLWGWFIEPYTGVATPSIWTLAAWLLIASIPFAKFDSTNRKPAVVLATGILFGLMYPPMVLLTGWIFRQFGG